MYRKFFFELILRQVEDGGGAAPTAPTPAPATPAPAGPAPSTATPTDAPADTGKESFNPFEALGARINEDDFDVLQEAPVPPTLGTPGAAAEPPAPVPPAPAPGTPPPAPTAPTPPAGTPPPPAPTEPPAAAATEPKPFVLPSDPVELARVMDENRVALIDGLAADRFALTDDEKLAIETDAVGAIPKLLARVYHEAMTTMYHQMGQRVPTMVKTFLDVSKQHDELEGKFYGKFPGLDKGKHNADVVMALRTIKSLNPKISQDDLWSMAGATVLAKHGLTNTAPANGTGHPAPTPTPPFRPATPGTPGPRVVVTEESNPFLPPEDLDE